MAKKQDEHQAHQHQTTSFMVNIAVILTGLILLLLGFLWSVSVGATDIGVRQIFQAVVGADGSEEAMVIRGLRFPRAVTGALVGANLAVAGAIMQGVTKNPLASPQIFGVNAGASFAVAFATVFLANLSPSAIMLAAFLGAAAGGMVVYSLSASGHGVTPVKLALAGMTVHLFLTSLTEGLILFHEHTTEDILFWLAGAVDGTHWEDVRILGPWTAAGLLGAFFIARSLTLLGLGEEMSRGLGQKNERIRFWAGILVIVLAGVSVAIAGPIGFVGLIIPHIVRQWVGSDYRMVIPCSALYGAVLLIYADVLSRYIAFPFESPVGIVTAIVGAPFFLYLARREGREEG